MWIECHGVVLVLKGGPAALGSRAGHVRISLVLPVEPRRRSPVRKFPDYYRM